MAPSVINVRFGPTFDGLTWAGSNILNNGVSFWILILASVSWLESVE